jgi:hypothetical protein
MMILVSAYSITYHLQLLFTEFLNQWNLAYIVL